LKAKLARALARELIAIAPVLLALAGVLSVQRIAQAEPNMEGLKYEVAFSYGAERGGDKEVGLIVTERFSNVGTTPITFSTSAIGCGSSDSRYLAMLQPAEAFTKRVAEPQLAMHAQPTRDSLMVLAPGQTRSFSHWDWAYAELPFELLADGKRHQVRLRKSADLELQMCVQLASDHAVFDPLLEHGETLSTGTLCAAPVHFRYRVLHQLPH
jgi:hypothetical protein